MNLGLFLIPALGGYYLLSRTLVSRYWVARQAGYKLFFSAAIAGVVLLPEIASARRFDPHVYELFRQTKTAGKNQPDTESAT